jgi:hypothetical protein
MHKECYKIILTKVFKELVTSVKMLQKLQEYKWYIVIGLATCIGLYLIYNSFTTNRKINMLYRCINELSLKIDDVSSNSVQSSKQSTPKVIKQQPTQQHRKMIYKESPRKKYNQVEKRGEVVLPPISPNKPTTVTETLIFKVSPTHHPPPVKTVTSSTIEEIDTDSDSDVDVESSDIKTTDLDKELEAELEELDS